MSLIGVGGAALVAGQWCLERRSAPLLDRAAAAANTALQLSKQSTTPNPIRNKKPLKQRPHSIRENEKREEEAELIERVASTGLDEAISAATVAAAANAASGGAPGGGAGGAGAPASIPEAEAAPRQEERQPGGGRSGGGGGAPAAAAGLAPLLPRAPARSTSSNPLTRLWRAVRCPRWALVARLLADRLLAALIAAVGRAGCHVARATDTKPLPPLHLNRNHDNNNLIYIYMHT